MGYRTSKRTGVCLVSRLVDPLMVIGCSGECIGLLILFDHHPPADSGASPGAITEIHHIRSRMGRATSLVFGVHASGFLGIDQITVDGHLENPAPRRGSR